MTLAICNLCAAHVMGASKTAPYTEITGHRHAGDRETLGSWVRGMKRQITRQTQPKHRKVAGHEKTTRSFF